MVRLGPRLCLTAMVLLIGFPASAESAFRLGVLRGPTAVAFAPMIDNPARLADGRVVEIRIYPDPPALTAAYLGGDVDAVTLPSNVAAQLSGRGSPIEVAATFIWGVLYLVGPRNVTLDELSGPVHSLGRGATPDIVLRYVLEQEGLTDRVRIEYGFGPVELAQLLIAGRVAAGVLPEPFVTRVLSRNPELGIVADLQERFAAHTDAGLPQTVLAVRPGRGVSDQLIHLLRTSVDEVLSDPDRTAGLVGRLGLGLDEETVRASLPRLNLRVESARRSREALRRYFAILYEFEPAAVGGRMPAPKFYGE